MFKVNKHLEDLIAATDDHIDNIHKGIKMAGDTKFLCCGTE